MSSEQPPPRVTLSLTQVLASALAAASAAVVASLFGVAGTVIGAVVMSVVATTATAVYQHWVRRTTDRLTSLAGPMFARPELANVRPPQLPWRRIGLTALLVLVLALAAITVVELAVGESLSALFHGKSGGGPSVTRLVPHARHRTPTVAPTRSPSPSPKTSSPRPKRSAPTSPARTSRPASSSPPAVGSPSPSGSPSAAPTSTSSPR